MDNKKIGQLISKLRKEKGLTQQQLGDMVGVGFRAVSKWERGITLPDISIINDVSKILGITSDELLAGELNEKNRLYNNKKQDHRKISKFILVAILFLIVIFSIFLYIKNKSYVYQMHSSVDDYYIEGDVTFKHNKIKININKLKFNDSQINNMVIENVEYRLKSQNKLITGVGFVDGVNLLSEPITIGNYIDDFKLYYENTNIYNIKKLENNGMFLEFTFVNNFEKRVNVEVKILLD